MAPHADIVLLALGTLQHYMSTRRSCGVRQRACISGALPILTGAVPERARGLAHTVPTYAVGLRDRKTSPTIAASLFSILALTDPSVSQSSAAKVKKKMRLRQQAMTRRKSLPVNARAAAAAVIADRAGALIASLRPATVASYWPIASECETQLLNARIHAIGAQVGFPTVVGGGRLIFRQHSPGDCLVDGEFGTREPAPSMPAVRPDLIVLPMVGFDRSGMRLGYGRGYYDSAISNLREAGQQPKLLGIAFSVQEVETIPAEPHDVRLDYIVTEKETLEFRTGKG